MLRYALRSEDLNYTAFRTRIHWIPGSHREGNGTVGDKANESGKIVEASGDRGKVWGKFEAREKQGLFPKQTKQAKVSKNKQYQEAKMAISFPAPGISWLRDVF